MKLVTCLAMIALLVTGASLAGADTVSYSASIPLELTDWTSKLSLPKFDTSLGTLDSVTINLSGSILGSVKFENKDSFPQTIELSHTGEEKFTLPDASTWTLSYGYQTTMDLAAYDGTTDYAGPSGFGYSGSASDNYIWTSSSASMLTLLSGPGTFDILAEATGNSQHTATGNYADLLDLEAGGSAEVVYSYTAPVVPEFGATALFLSGISGVVGYARLRRRTMA